MTFWRAKSAQTVQRVPVRCLTNFLAWLPFERPAFTCAWLADNTKDKKDEEAVLNIPKKTNGEECTLERLIGDQREAMGYILNKTCKCSCHIRRMQECNPLWLTVSGAGGSSKSVLINTIASVLQKAFGCSNAVHVCRPTGSAAFNAGGVATHRLFGIAKMCTSSNLNANKQKKLLQDFGNATCLVVDERSMMSAELLGKMEHCAKVTAQMPSPSAQTTIQQSSYHSSIPDTSSFLTRLALFARCC
jgi:hypothetical protein